MAAKGSFGTPNIAWFDFVTGKLYTKINMGDFSAPA